MATLQSIRSKGPLLLIIIGLAMLAFILGDAWKIIRPNQGIQYVGTIAGEDITAMDFQDELEVYTDVVKFANQISDITEEEQNSLKDEVWSTMVRTRLIENEAKGIGLTVTDAEVRDVIERGTDPMLARTPFSNTDGGFDADVLKSFLAFYKELDPSMVQAEEYQYYQSMYNYWLFIEKNIKSNLLYDKYTSLIKASILCNPVASKSAFDNRIKRADVLMALLPYSSIADADVKVTSSDLKAVYNEAKPSLYNYSESRDIVYIDYEILPSQADRDALLAEVNEIVDQLEGDVEDYASFLRRAGSVESFSEVARSAKNLPMDVAERLDSVKEGGVFGPYYSAYDDTYNAFKYISSTTGYDSIQFALIQVDMEDEAAAEKRADSIITAARKRGADFQAIAQNYGQSAPEQWLAADSYEPAAIDGENALYVNTLNSMKKGDVTRINVQGVILIIKVSDVKTPLKKYNLAVVKRPVEFSEETSNAAYNKLSAFLSQNTTVEDLKNNAEDSDFRLLFYPGFENYNHNVGGVAKSREALRWAFEAQEGEVSRIYEVGNANDHLLAVGVEKINPRGTRSIQDAAASLSLKALNNKKFEVLKGQLAGKSIDELKAIDGVRLDTIRSLNFNNDAYISSIFSNEAIVGPSVFNLEQNELTVPMKGENCAFVAEKISEDRYTAEFDEASESLRTRSMVSSRIMGSILEELYYKAKVVDNRYQIF
ncbi:MAG: SurA N-terminal domain-containing protein [Bacteroidaceae bacterium]|nr:SurA N-terminal domain-containing protein [Bacteroidaceae bacterium]